LTLPIGATSLPTSVETRARPDLDDRLWPMDDKAVLEPIEHNQKGAGTAAN
jgi:hypothetical protein